MDNFQNRTFNNQTQFNFVLVIIMKYLNISKILFAGLASFATGYFIYYAGKIFYVRRKYKHIPGPETKGYIYSIQMFLIIYFLLKCE